MVQSSSTTNYPYGADISDGTNGGLYANGTKIIDENGQILAASTIVMSDGDAIEDNNGNELVEFGVTASAVNHIGITNSATGDNPIISCEGEADTGITFTNSEGEEVLILDSVATSVNEVTISSAATGSGPSISATGGDTNIDLALVAKGTGQITSADGIAITIADTTNKVGLTVTQNDTTNNPNALVVANSGTGDSVVIDTDSFVVDSDGNVGVGTATPNSDAVVSPTLETAGRFYSSSGNANGGYWAEVNGGHKYSIRARTGSNLFQINDETNSATRMTIDTGGNVGINSISFGTSAAGVLSLGTGTAPTTGPADTVQLYSLDLSAGNTMLGIRTEGTGAVGTGTPTADRTVAMDVNGTTLYFIASTSAT